jgi:two-component system, chemotaxis family, sensor kinase CheA
MNALDMQEFQALFAQEAEIRLATLAQLMLQLEHEGGDEALIGSIFREVHTLKGSAAVVGFDNVSRVAHLLESGLEDLRSGRCAVTPDLVDGLLTAVGSLSTLIAQAVAGEDGGSAAAAAEAALELALERFVTDETLASQPVAGEPVAGGAVTDEPLADDPVASQVEPKLVTSVAMAPEAIAKPRSATQPEPAAREGGIVMVPLERLDELVRLVGESAAAHLRVGRMLSAPTGIQPDAIAEFSELSRILNELQERTMRTRMVPVATVTDQLNRTVRDLARSLGKVVHWEVRGGDTELDRGVLHQLSDSLIHLVRNAVDHGIDSADLSDDDALQLVFRSGLSTARFVSDISGRGVGLDVVRASVEAVRGRVEVRSQHGVGTEFRVVVPVTLAVLPCLLVMVSGQRFALALHSVVLAQADQAATQAHAEGRPAIWIDGQPVPVSSLAETLRMPPTEPAHGPVVVLAGTSHRHAFQVDGLIGQRDVVVKGIGRLLPRLEVIAGRARSTGDLAAGHRTIRAARPAAARHAATKRTRAPDTVAAASASASTVDLALIGQTAAANGDYPAAVTAFRKCVYLEPDDPMAHVHLGLALEASGDEPSAGRAFQAARSALGRGTPSDLDAALGGYRVEELLRLLDSKRHGSRRADQEHRGGHTV